MFVLGAGGLTGEEDIDSGGLKRENADKRRTGFDRTYTLAAGQSLVKRARADSHFMRCIHFFDFPVIDFSFQRCLILFLLPFACAGAFVSVVYLFCWVLAVRP